MHQALRRVAASRLLWAAAVAAVLLLIYTLGSFMLAPYLIERYLPTSHGRSKTEARSPR